MRDYTEIWVGPVSLTSGTHLRHTCTRATRVGNLKFKASLSNRKRVVVYCPLGVPAEADECTLVPKVTEGLARGLVQVHDAFIVEWGITEAHIYKTRAPHTVGWSSSLKYRIPADALSPEGIRCLTGLG